MSKLATMTAFARTMGNGNSGVPQMARSGLNGLRILLADSSSKLFRGPVDAIRDEVPEAALSCRICRDHELRPAGLIHTAWQTE